MRPAERDHGQDSVESKHLPDTAYWLALPGVLERLRRIAQKNEAGRRKHKLFQRLTSSEEYPGFGNPFVG